MMESRCVNKFAWTPTADKVENTCVTGTWATFLKNGSHPICRFSVTDENTVEKQVEHIRNVHEPIYKLLKAIPLVAWIKTRSNDAEKKYGPSSDVVLGKGLAINTSKDNK